jgi:hypothetical protein
MNRHGPFSRLGLGALALLALGCRETIHVTVDRASTGQQLRLRVTDSRENGPPSQLASVVVVLACDRVGGKLSLAEALRWRIRRVERGKPLPLPLLYGQTPPGWTREVGPLDLRTGCYYVVVNGDAGARGGTQFTIDSSGAVRETTSSEP